MARPTSAPTPTTALGAALIERRGSRPVRVVAEEIGTDPAVYHRLEAGQRQPSLRTALQLARWLGWPVERVVEAATQPLPLSQPT